MAQVYAIIHDGAGNFMIATKPQRGYFFNWNGRSIHPQGVLLNGGGFHTFPGGRLGNNEAPAAGARREFLEETNVDLNQVANQLSPPYYNGNQGQYFGVYYNLGGNFVATAGTVNGNVQIGTQATNDIVNNIWNNTYDVTTLYPGCPEDNELDTTATWDLRADMNQVNALRQNQATDWFFNILYNLALRTFGVVVMDQGGNMAGIGTAVNQIAGPQYSIIGFSEDPVVPLQPGVAYNIRRLNQQPINNVQFVNLNAGVAIFQ